MTGRRSAAKATYLSDAPSRYCFVRVSAHVAILERAGLVSSKKIGRSVIYRAEITPAEEPSGFFAHACERRK